MASSDMPAHACRLNTTRSRSGVPGMQRSVGGPAASSSSALNQRGVLAATPMAITGRSCPAWKYSAPAPHLTGAVEASSGRRSRTMLRRVNAVTAAKLWLTNSTVRPLLATSDMRFEAALLNSASPTASTSSIDQDLRFQMRGHGEGQAHVHADRVALDRRVDELARRSEKSTISSNCRRDLGAASCRGWRRSGRCSRGRSARDGSPVPTSSRLATRPLISTRPVVGSVMRDRILSSVRLAGAVAADDADQLAALDLEVDVAAAPRIPRRSLDDAAGRAAGPSPLRHRLRAPLHHGLAEHSPRARSRWPMTNFLPRLSARMTTSAIVRPDRAKLRSVRRKVRDAHHSTTATIDQAERKARQVELALAAEHAPAEAVDDADHRVEAVEQAAIAPARSRSRSRPARRRGRTAR